MTYEAIRCPKCRAPMEALDVEGTILDRCTGCMGLWFDSREDERPEVRRAAAKVDRGDVKIGLSHDAETRITCPRCSTRMIHLVDPEHSEIGYETCPVCHGSFYDAGEFRDLAAPGFLAMWKRRRAKGA